jgi:hypothetical protein
MDMNMNINVQKDWAPYNVSFSRGSSSKTIFGQWTTFNNIVSLINYINSTLLAIGFPTRRLAISSNVAMPLEFDTSLNIGLSFTPLSLGVGCF